MDQQITHAAAALALAASVTLSILAGLNGLASHHHAVASLAAATPAAQAAVVTQRGLRG